MFVRSIRHKQKLKAMKKRAIELQEKANQLLQMAQDMDKRVDLIRLFMDEAPLPTWYQEKQLSKLDTCTRGSKRLWNAYLQVLTQIKLEL